MARLVAVAGAVALACSVASCAPELGACDPEASVRVAYDQATGMPAYEGQAALVASCGYGAFCHGAEATFEDRLGVPAGLELDVRIVGPDGAVDEAQLARLRHGRFRVVQQARAILQAIDAGSMPPDGPRGGEVALGAPVYVRIFPDVGSAALPSVASPEGRDVLRNWLACGAPVVERPVPRDDGAAAVVVPPLVLPPLEPTWESIFRDLLGARGCAAARCHGGSDAGFRVTDAEATHAELVGAPASGDECDGMGTLVVPGEPGASLFLAKLAAREGEVCGDPMPIAGIRTSDADRAAIEQWIAEGAPL